MYDVLANAATVEQLIPVLHARGIESEYVHDRHAALERLKSLMPAGAEVNSGFSTTLEEIGFVDWMKSGKHAWKNVKQDILAERDHLAQHELRKRGVLSEYFLGSVHAVTRQGQTLTASGTGSQLPSYAYTSRNVIWVVGTQKIVSDLETALKRIEEYAFPLEEKRMRAVGLPGTALSKILLINAEISPLRKVRMILVGERLGF
jgi:hypothetical protein